MSRLFRDLRPAVRSLRRTGAASAVVVLTVAVGIAAGTTVFSVVDALMLKPLPGVARQRELVNVHATAPDGTSFHAVSYPTYRDLAEGNGAFEALAAFSSRLASLSTENEPRFATVQLVTGNFFTLLGARPALGRFFGPSEDAVPGRDAVVVVSHRLWRERLGADRSAVGRSITLNGHPFTVVGVAPPRFTGTFHIDFDVWAPLMTAPVLSPGPKLDERSFEWLEMVGRLRPGVSLASARSRMATLAKRLEAAYPDIYRGIGYDLLSVNGFEDSLRAPAIRFFAVLSVLAGLVLAIAGVNVSGILLARAMARERELAVRFALGAERGAVLRLLLTETLLLFLAGGAGGLLLAQGAASLLERFQLPTPVPVAFDLTPGPRTLLFTLALSAAAGLLFGLLAALPATRPGRLALLRSGLSGDSRAASGLRRAFVVAQVAMSVLLLVVSGLLWRTVANAVRVHPGFEPDGLTMTMIDLDILGYDAQRGRAFFETLQERLRGLPQVESVATAGVVPLGPANRTTGISLPGWPPGERPLSVDTSQVSDDFFRTMRIPILRGRAFTDRDTPGGSLAAIVNETLARRLWPGEDPVGRTLRRGEDVLTVVGVARDGKYRKLWEATRPYLYTGARQDGRVRRQLLVRGGGAFGTLAAALRREIRALEPALPIGTIRPVREHIGFSLLPQRVAGAVAGVLGLVGAGLAAIGLAGLVAYSVTRRTREIGIRMALGASPGDALRLEMRQGARTAALGLALGLAGALAFTRLISGLLFGVGAADPLTFAAAALLLFLTALVAAYLPARRAARVDPMLALRSE
jgi:predicted permease